MSGFKGTPGPWVVSYADNPKHGFSWGGYWQIDAQYDAVACNQFCYAGNNKPDVSEANARLIAAAPDLLEMLIACRDQFDFYAQEHRKAEKHEKARTNEKFAFLATQAIKRALSEGEEG